LEVNRQHSQQIAACRLNGSAVHRAEPDAPRGFPEAYESRIRFGILNDCSRFAVECRTASAGVRSRFYEPDKPQFLPAKTEGRRCDERILLGIVQGEQSEFGAMKLDQSVEDCGE